MCAAPSRSPVQQADDLSSLPKDWHAAARATATHPDPRQPPPAANLQVSSPLTCVQPPEAVGAAVAVGSSANACQQQPLTERLTIELPAAPQPEAHEALEATNGHARGALRSPDGQHWVDPLEMVCMPVATRSL